MDTKRTPLPLLSRPKRLGQPYHGLLRNGRLTLSTGRVIEWPSGGVVAEYGGRFGDCYKLQVPGVPPVNLAPVEVASEAAAGREWRHYALLTGTARNYAGINVGTNAWLYAAADGTVWRIECDQLDKTSIRPTLRSASSFDGVYPAGATFTFKVRRFGVVSPDDALPVLPYTHVIYQAWGGEIVSDPLYDNGQVTPLERRLFPGDGAESQWMPINIEDVNSRGDQVIFGVNRSLEQSVSRPESGRAAPRAWLRVDVTGSGAGIAISMSVLRFGDGGTGSSTSNETRSEGVALSYWDDGFNDPYILNLGPASVVTGRSASMGSSGVVIGFYFDANDVIQSVAVEQVTETTNWASSGTSSLSVGGGGWVSNASAGFTFSSVASAAVRMGPHSFSPPSVSASAGGNAWSDGNTSLWNFSVTVSGGVLGDCVFSADDTTWDYQSGWASVDGVGAGSSVVTVCAAEWWTRLTYMQTFNAGAGNVREWDGLTLRRISNKVYALVADLGFGRSGQQTGFKVIAYATPDGWTTSGGIANTLYASYNPGTGEFAHSTNEALGWV